MRKPTLLLAATLLMLTACVSTQHARKVEPSGFLGDSASLLKKGSKDDFLLVYRSGDARWASYDAVVVDPITMWAIQDSKLSPEVLGDYQRLVDQFDQTLRSKLSKDYRVTDTAAPGVLRLQIAIVNGKQAAAPLKVAKVIAPYAGPADTLWTFITGKPAFTGEVSIEFMVRDSSSGALLAAGADRRVGGGQLGKATLTGWGDVQNALAYWSDAAVYRLCLDRKGTPCTKPKAGLIENPLW